MWTMNKIRTKCRLLLLHGSTEGKDFEVKEKFQKKLLEKRGSQDSYKYLSMAKFIL